ncbi:hypothetical protein GGF37_004759, partial [Kickxella alabastrina]
MEFWKRKKGVPQSPHGPGTPGAGTTSNNSSSSANNASNTGSINPATISEPIHNLEPFISFGSMSTNIPSSSNGSGGMRNTGAQHHSPSQGEYPSNSFGDQEFRDRYKSYRQQRRQSHSSTGAVPGARSSQLSTGSNEYGNRSTTPVQQGEMFQPAPGMAGRQRNHDKDSILTALQTPSQRTVSTVSNTSSHMSGYVDVRSADEVPGGMGGNTPRGSLRSTRSSAAGGGGTVGGRGSIPLSSVVPNAISNSIGMSGDQRDSTYSTHSMRSAGVSGRQGGQFSHSPSTVSVASNISISGGGGAGRRSGVPAIGGPTPAASL